MKKRREKRKETKMFALLQERVFALEGFPPFLSFFLFFFYFLFFIFFIFIIIIIILNHCFLFDIPDFN